MLRRASICRDVPDDRFHIYGRCGQFLSKHQNLKNIKGDVSHTVAPEPPHFCGN